MENEKESWGKNIIWEEYAITFNHCRNYTISNDRIGIRLTVSDKQPYSEQSYRDLGYSLLGSEFEGDDVLYNRGRISVRPSGYSVAEGVADHYCSFLWCRCVGKP